MTHELEIASSCSPAEYTAALDRLLTEQAACPSPDELPRKGAIRGKISGNKVTLYSRSLMNDFAPVFSGEILSANGGMILRGNFRHARSVRIQLFLFRCFAVLFSTAFLAVILYASYSNREFNPKIVVALLVPIALTIGMLIGVSRLSRIDPGPLKKFIQQSFQSIPENR